MRLLVLATAILFGFAPLALSLIGSDDTAFVALVVLVLGWPIALGASSALTRGRVHPLRVVGRVGIAGIGALATVGATVVVLSETPGPGSVLDAAGTWALLWVFAAGGFGLVFTVGAVVGLVLFGKWAV